MATDKNKPLLKVDRRTSTEFNHLSLRWVPSTTGSGNLINESVIQWDDDDDNNKRGSYSFSLDVGVFDEHQTIEVYSVLMHQSDQQPRESGVTSSHW